MQSKDLRIGNYYMFAGDNGIVYRQIKEIKHNQFGFECDYDGVNFGICQGIKLNEEWLLKFGFKQEPSCTFFTLRISRTSLITWDKNYGLEISCKNFTVIGNKKHFEVHQLQNLYFALTGEELELKNETKP